MSGKKDKKEAKERTKEKEVAKKDKKEYVPPNKMSAEKQRRFLQCFLADNLMGLTGLRVKGTTNFFNVLGESRSVRNKLISLKGAQGFFNIPGPKLAQLVPSIRIFKQGNKSSSEFLFDDQISRIDHITATRTGRGSNVGFKSFSYDMKGGSPATAESLVEAKLSLHFASLTDLFADRDPAFTDLLGQPGKLKKGAKCVITASDREKAQNSDYYKIAIELGYNVPKSWANEGGGEKLKEEVEGISRTFSLTLVQHSIDFKEDGSVTLELEYQAYVDKLLINADVFDIADSKAKIATVKSLERKACKEEQAIKKSKKKPASNCGPKAAPPEGPEEDSEEIEDKKDRVEEIREQQGQEKSIIYAALFDALFDKASVNMIKVKAEDFMQGKMTPNKTVTKAPDIKKDAKKIMKKMAKHKTDTRNRWFHAGAGETGNESIKDNVTGKDADGFGVYGLRHKGGSGFTIKVDDDWGDINRDSEIPIPFFFFGDLLDAAFACAYGREYNNLKFLVGTFPYRKGGSGPAVDVPLANIPISTQLFQAWFAEHVLLKERTSYPLKTFISDVFSNLIRPALAPDNCFGTEHLVPRLGIETIEAPTGQGKKCQVTKTGPKTKAGRPIGGNGINIKYRKKGNTSENRADMMYYYVYATSIKQVKRSGDLSVGQKAQDEASGIYWLKAGSETGLVKRVKFKKTDQEGVKEARIEAEGPTGANMIVDRYNADVEMYGTSLFKPGMTVFIDPITSAISSERTKAISIGLGGYYKVIKVGTVMEPGVYKTDLECVWESKSNSTSTSGGCK